MKNFFEKLEKHRELNSFDVDGIGVVFNDLITELQHENLTNKQAVNVIGDLIAADMVDNETTLQLSQTYNIIKSFFLNKTDLETAKDFIQNVADDVLRKETKQFLISKLN